MEIALPDMSGFELLVKLCPVGSTPAVAVVILTKIELSTLSQLAKGSGAQAYLTKSHASGDQLDATIRKAMAKLGPREKRTRTEGVVI